MIVLKPLDGQNETAFAILLRLCFRICLSIGGFETEINKKISFSLSLSLFNFR